MKRYFWAVTAVLFILHFGIPAGAADLKEGFMEYRWGAAIGQFDGMKKLYSKSDITYYGNPGESYTIDDTTINDVVFGFYQDRLLGVYINISAPEVYDNVRLHMKSKYGLPDRKTSTVDRVTTYKWKYQDISIKLKTNEIDGTMKLAFYYKPLTRELKNDRLDQISDDSFQFLPIDKNERPRMVPLLEF